MLKFAWNLIIILALMIPLPYAQADIIYLKNGNKIEGIVAEKVEDSVMVKIKNGAVTFPLNMIDFIHRQTDEENQAIQQKWEEEEKETEKFIEELKEEVVTKNAKEKTSKEAEKPTQKVKKQEKSKSKKFAGAGQETKRRLEKLNIQSYWLYLPKDYNPKAKWPLFIAVHGYKHEGRQQLFVWKKYADKEKFILVCPNFPPTLYKLGRDTDKRMIWIMEEIEKDYSIDKNRIFMTGFSGGAQFAHRFIFKHPKYVKAVSLMGAGDYDSPSNRARKIKFLVTVGEHDTERIDVAEKFVEELEDMRFDVKFKIIPDTHHEISQQAIEMTLDLYRKMLKMR